MPDENRFSNEIVFADSRVLLARGYQAAGENDKAVRELKKAAIALEGIVRRTNDALKTVRNMQEEITAGSRQGKLRK